MRAQPSYMAQGFAGTALVLSSQPPGIRQCLSEKWSKNSENSNRMRVRHINTQAIASQ